MEIPFLDLKLLDRELKEALRTKFAAMLDAGIFSGGEEVNLLESRLSRKLNSAFVMTCANGTDALELALRALDIGAEDACYDLGVDRRSCLSGKGKACVLGYR